MKMASRVLGVALLGAACSEDRLAQDPALLNIEPRVIDLGATPVHGTKWAVFRLSNTADFALTVTSVDYLSAVKDLWAVAEITWQSGGTGFVTSYPSDAPPATGAVKTMTDCAQPGFAF